MTLEAAKEAFCERETEHFGHCPFTILDVIGAKIVEEYARMVGELSQRNVGLSKPQWDTIVAQWTLQVEAALDRNFELFEAYCIRNVFSVPDNYQPLHVQALLDCEEDESCIDKELQTIMSELESVYIILYVIFQAYDFQRQLREEEWRVSEEKRMLDRVESLFAQLKQSLDTHYDSGTFEATMSSVADKLTDLRMIVNETLTAASNFLLSDYPSEPTCSQHIYEQLLKELTVIDPDAMAAKENKLQQEAQVELAKRLEVASVQDIQVFVL